MVRQRRFLCASLLVATFLVHGGTAAQDFKAALADAYDSNPSLKAERARFRGTVEEIPEALSRYLPQILGELGATAARVRAEGADSDSGDASDLDEDASQRLAALSLNLNVYNGGSDQARVRGAGEAVRAAAAALRVVEADVLFDATTAYADVWRAQQVLTLLRNEYEALNGFAQRIQSQVEQQRATRTDAAQARTEALTIARRIAETETLAADATARFRVLVGRDPEAILGWPDVVINVSGPDDAVNLAKARNPAVQRQTALLAASRQRVRQFRGAYFPTADAFLSLQREWDKARYTSSSDYTEHDTEDNFELGVTVRIPLYTGGARTARVRNAREGEEEQRQQLALIDLQSREEAKAQWRRLTLAQQQTELAALEAAAANESREGFERRYVDGATTITEVFIARRTWRFAVIGKINADRELLLAKMSLLKVVGSLSAAELQLPVEEFSSSAYVDQARSRFFTLGD